MIELERMVLEITEACPHRCVHCYNYWRDERGATEKSLDRSSLVALVRKAKEEAPLTQIGISGGEPLSRADAPLIARDLAEMGLGVVVITNGTLMTDAVLRDFPEQTVFEITLFGADRDVHDSITGVKGSFDAVLAGAAAAARTGRRLAGSVVVDKMNANDVRRAIELGIAIGCQGFLINRMNISRLALGSAQALAPEAKELEAALDAAESAAAEYGVLIAASVPVPPCVVDVSKYVNLHFGWCPRGGPESYYTIGHTGKVRPCNHSSRILGDLRLNSLTEIVEGAASKDFWGPIPEKCRSCALPFAESCKGGCPAASDECYGTRSIRDPYAELFATRDLRGGSETPTR